MKKRQQKKLNLNDNFVNEYKFTVSEIGRLEDFSKNTDNQILNNACCGTICQSKKKQKKFVKVACGISLSIFMGTMAFLGAACTPNSVTTSGSQGAQGISGAESGSSTASSSISNPFNLNAQSDPTMFTTQSGLNIKFGGVNGTVESGALTGYAYITMGAYNNTPVNWVIIGYNSSLGYLFSGEVINGGNGLLDDTLIDGPAGEAIKNNNWYSPYGVQNDTELKAGEVLVISQGTLGTACFDAETSYSNDYNSSDCELRKYVETLYNVGLNFSVAEKSLIQPKTLTNYGTGGSITSNAYMFPLAARGENFTISTYLTSNALRTINSDYSLRSGRDSDISTSYYIFRTGAIEYNANVTNSVPVRPAMVLKL